MLERQVGQSNSHASFPSTGHVRPTRLTVAGRRRKGDLNLNFLIPSKCIPEEEE